MVSEIPQMGCFYLGSCEGMRIADYPQFVQVSRAFTRSEVLWESHLEEEHSPHIE